MGHLFFITVLAALGLVGLIKPWVGVVGAYVIVVLVPQAVWWWDFGGIRPAIWVMLPTGIGAVIGLMRGQFDISILLNKRNLFILTLWCCFAISYYFGPYTNEMGPYRFDDPEATFGIINKIMVLYFIGCLCIDTEQKLRVLFYAVACAALYLVYWANSQYLAGHVIGRLAGPTDIHGRSIYQDENDFAMLFVVAQAFFWHLGLLQKRAVWRWAWWLVIPFCWHAVFLTASRGGLLGLGVTTLLIALRSKRKLLGIALIPAFVIAYMWQGGTLMKTRADTIEQYQTEASAETRLQAWRAAENMIADHPFTGVGLSSFGPAFPHYSNDKPREAHNTILQIAAESGVLAGTMWALIAVTSVIQLWRVGKDLQMRSGEGQDSPLSRISETVLIALCGMMVCGMFLSLQIYEIFYCVNVLANAVLYQARRQISGESDLEGAPATHIPGSLSGHAEGAG